MAKEMARRAVIRALKRNGCETTGRGRGPHEKWVCGCGKHTALIPRSGAISPGVVKDTIDRMSCLAEGWLQ
ncbi:hypothetical protein [Actinomadura bangladeshensis]|nr:hypothetical protein [Actinomadura bangladeshensis]